MMKPKFVNQITPDCDLIAQEFVSYLKKQRNSKRDVQNIVEELHYWALESEFGITQYCQWN